MTGVSTMNNYWAKRTANAQNHLTDLHRKQIDTQMRKHYQRLSKQVIEDFENTYNKLLATVAAGQKPTPADLYKMDKYWSMLGQLEDNLSKLGRRQIKDLTKSFRRQYWDMYNSLEIKGAKLFSTIDDKAIEQVISQIWCADGKSWSQRIWENTKLLKETLNEGLVHCVATGKKPTQLKRLLMERFSVAYSRADVLVRTEMAHIQTQAAQQRYKDYGIQEMEVWVDEDERTCPICAKNEGKIYPVNAKMPVPFHPRCRCCMIPVIK